MGLKTGVALRFDVAREQPGAVELKERLEEVSTAVVHNPFDFVVARVVEETLVVQVSLVELHGGTVVAKHELLESKEAGVPTITFSV